MAKDTPKLQQVTAERFHLETIRVPRKGGGYVTFNLTQPLSLKRGDAYLLENCKPTKASVVPILDDTGEPVTWQDGTPATRTQIDTVELRFSVKRAGHRKIKSQWRYGNAYVVDDNKVGP